IAPVAEAHFGEEPLLQLNLASARRWPSFAAELEEAAGTSSGYRQTATLIVARDRDDREELDRLLAYQQQLGLKVEWVGSREARDLEPFLSPRVVGGLLASDDHQADPQALVAALTAACERVGVEFVSQRAAAVTRRGNRVTGVRLRDGGEILAGTTVIAAGAWSGALEGLPERAIPVRPVKGQILVLRGPVDPPLAYRNVRSPEVYLVPRADGRIVVGATAEEKGFDTTVTAGAVLDLLRRAYEVLPGLTELAFEASIAGLRPGSPDNAPLLGDGPLDDLVVATGHFRHGILLTPSTADVVSERLLTGRWPELARPFAPDRFGGPA
ncbi:MAG: glycine oxidase ThiO, partial [Nitriliruptorales bacterium]